MEEWGTSGKIRPDLQTLMNLLYEVNLIRAAEAIASKISKGNAKLFIIFVSNGLCEVLFKFSFRLPGK